MEEEKYLEFRKGERLASKQLEDAITAQFVKICEIQEKFAKETHRPFRVITPIGEVSFIFRPEAIFSYSDILV